MNRPRPQGIASQRRVVSPRVIINLPPADAPDRRHDFRVATFAGTAGLIAAFIGAVIGGLFSADATRDQVAASAEQSQTAFVREQRIAAYSDLLSAVGKLTAKESAMFEAIDRLTVDPVPDVPNFMNALHTTEDQIESMRPLENRIIVVSSESVRTAASAIIRSHEALVERAQQSAADAKTALSAESQSTEEMTSPGIVSVSRAQTANERAEVDRSYRTFLEQIRTELAIN